MVVLVHTQTTTLGVITVFTSEQTLFKKIRFYLFNSFVFCVLHQEVSLISEVSANYSSPTSASAQITHADAVAGIFLEHFMIR